MFEYQELSSRDVSQNGSAVRSRSLFLDQNCGLMSASIDAGWNMIGQPCHGEPGTLSTAHRFARLGFPKSSPVSMTATLTPCPSNPICQASYALCSRAIAQLVGETSGAALPSGPGGFSPAATRALNASKAAWSSANAAEGTSVVVMGRTVSTYCTYGSAASGRSADSGTWTLIDSGTSTAPQGRATNFWTRAMPSATTESCAPTDSSILPSAGTLS